MTNIVHYIIALLKIGSGKKLFAFDLVAWGIVLYDFMRIKTSYVWPKFTLKTFLVAIVVIFIPPLLSAAINFFVRNVEKFRQKTVSSNWRDASFVFHGLTSIALALFTSMSGDLEVLSGFNASYADYVVPHSLSSFQYSPFYMGLVYGVFGSGFLGLLLSLLSFFGYRKELKADFRMWFRLSDTSSEYFPKQKAKLIFVNTASMAPTINSIITQEELYRHTYQRKVPTSDDAKDYLMLAASESRNLLLEYLFQGTNRHGHFSIEFLPGTSRALEVGLTQIDNLGAIIVSPYEHPSQNDVVKWFVSAFNPSIAHHELEIDYTILKASWDQQKSRLIEQIQSVIAACDARKKIAVLISEVHYMTGLVINVNEIIDALRPRYRNSNLVFMVDGSQSVGNLLSPLSTLVNNLHREDFYYFSAHKWLLSPNTCGVFVAEQNPSRYEIEPYDIFGATLPSATVDPGVIFGIRSSLQYLIGDRMSKLKSFHEISCLLKSYFRENIGDQFEVVESVTREMNESLFIAVRPKPGNRWKEETRQAFWTQIREDGVDLTVLKLQGVDPTTWWLRISFPYFLQLHLLKQLIKHLQKRVVSINN
jgi:selenocysteine lyase/cysteine desulfurase